jgi:hypothetical protein
MSTCAIGSDAVAKSHCPAIAGSSHAAKTSPAVARNRQATLIERRRSDAGGVFIA